MKSHSGGRLGLGLTAVVFLLILLPSLTGRSLLAYRDMLHNYWPMKEAYWNRPGGLLLTWNPDLFGGMSYLADLIQQSLYPPNLAFRFFGVPAATGIPWYLMLHGLLALAGVFLLARRILGGPAAVCAAATFLLSGFLMSTLSTGLNLYCAYSWGPLVLWSALRLAREPSRRNWALVALLTPMPLYAGDPQAFLEVAAVAGAIFLLAARPSPRQALLVGGALLLAVGFLVAAPVRASLEVIPDLLRQSQMEATGRGIWSFHPARLAELYVPELFGPLCRPGFWGQFTVNGPWPENYIHSVYVGALLPALLYMAIRHRARLGLPILAGLLFFTWLALGVHSFGYDLLLRWIPGWEHFRYPERLMLLPTLAAALLVGIGAEVLWARSRREQTRVILGSMAAGLLTLLACVRLAPQSPMADAASRIAVGASLIQLVAVGGAALLWTRLPPSRYGPLLFLGLLLADLTVANHSVGQLPKKPFAAKPRVCAAIEEAAREGSAGLPALWRVHVDEEALNAARRVVPARIGRALPSWGGWRWLEYQWGKRNILNLCGLYYSVGLSSYAPLSSARIWNQAGPLRALRATSTRFVVTDSRSRLNEASDARLLRAAPSEGLRLLELREALPRLYRPATVEALGWQAFLDRVPEDARLLTARLAVLERALPLRAHPPASRSVVLAFEDDGDSLHFEIEQDKPGYWVLTDTFDPHWRAWIDGEPAPLEKADLRHRALWIPAGSHRVRMAYQPRLILALAAGAALGALALAALAIRPASASRGMAMPDRRRGGSPSTSTETRGSR